MLLFSLSKRKTLFVVLRFGENTIHFRLDYRIDESANGCEKRKMSSVIIGVIIINHQS
jgi:hypothetical protein